MPHPTKHKKQSIKACEGKAACQSIKRNIDNVDYNNIDESTGPDIDNAFLDNGYDEPMEINNAVNIVKKLQEAAKKYYKENTSHKVRRSCYIGNSVCAIRRKNQQQREAAKGTFTLYTFWKTKHSTDEIDNENSEPLNNEINEIEDYN
jgi:hypothetical protein